MLHTSRQKLKIFVIVVLIAQFLSRAQAGVINKREIVATTTQPYFVNSNVENAVEDAPFIRKNESAPSGGNVAISTKLFPESSSSGKISSVRLVLNGIDNHDESAREHEVDKSVKLADDTTKVEIQESIMTDNPIQIATEETLSKSKITVETEDNEGKMKKESDLKRNLIFSENLRIYNQKENLNNTIDDSSNMSNKDALQLQETNSTHLADDLDTVTEEILGKVKDTVFQTSHLSLKSTNMDSNTITTIPTSESPTYIPESVTLMLQNENRMEAATVRHEPMILKLQDPTQSVIEHTTESIDVTDFFKANDKVEQITTTTTAIDAEKLPDLMSTASTSTATPSTEPVPQVDINSSHINSTPAQIIQNAIEDSNEITVSSSNSSTEKRGKFINDNSTNTNQLNLPNAAEVWTLASMKTVPKPFHIRNSTFMQKSQEADLNTERSPNNSIMSSNSEKNILDWTQIMINGDLDGKRLDNLVETTSTTERSEVNEKNNNQNPFSGATEVKTTTPMTVSNQEIQNRTEIFMSSTIATTENPKESATTPILQADANTIAAIEDQKLDIKNGSKYFDKPLLSDITSTSTITPLIETNETNYEKESIVLDELLSTTTTAAPISALMLPTLSTDNKRADVMISSTTILPSESSPKMHSENNEPYTTTTQLFLLTKTSNSSYNESNNELEPETTTSKSTLDSFVVLPVETSTASTKLLTATIVTMTAATTSTEKNDEHIAAEALPENHLSTNLQHQQPTGNASNIEVTLNTDNNYKVYNNETTNADGGGDQDHDKAAKATLELSINETTTLSAPEANAVNTTADEQISTQSEEVVTLDITSSVRTTTALPIDHTEPNTSAEVNHNMNKVDLDTTTQLINKSSSTNKEIGEATSPENELISTRLMTTTVATPVPTITTELVSEVVETTTFIITNSDSKDNALLPEQTDENEAPQEKENSIETNVIDPLTESKSNSDSKPTQQPEAAEGNEAMLRPQTASTTSIPIVSTTTEAPLISLLDDFTTSSTTTSQSPIVSTKVEEIYSVFSTETYFAPTTYTIAPSTVPKLTEAALLPFSTTMLPPIIQTTSKSELGSPHLRANSDDAPETDVNVIIAISVSVIGIVALILLVAFLYVMRKRQKQMSYGQRCRPVSLDAYSMDNVSVYNSVRRKSELRASKRSYGNVAFDDPSLRHNILNSMDLAKFIERRSSVFEEFRDVPQIIARADEVPRGCEDKNRYANVVPLPETRVILQQLNNDEKTEYINANYVRGPKDSPNYYIACQAPLESTVADFWRMIWEQQSRVIIQATDLMENGIEKCAEYLPPSVTLDNHTTYGDFQVTLKNREVKDKYAISTIMLKNTVVDDSRELTHYWYKWPEAGVPNEEAPIIAMLLEARSSLKSYSMEEANELKEKSSTITLKSDASSSNAVVGDNSATYVSPLANGIENKETSTTSGSNVEINGNVSSDKLRATSKNQGPLTVHCSPGTGRSGTIIACDMAVRSLETPKRNVDIPQIVYYVRRGRASAVQTKEQYEFIYKVANMYATKITNLSNDN